MKFLVNALSGNGDALMFSPSLRLLRDRFPDAEIDMLVMFKSVKEMYERHPALSRIYHIDFLKQSKFTSLRQVRELSRNGYDVSFNVYPSNRFEYNFLNALLGARKKIAHSYSHTNLLRCEFFNDVLVPETAGRHNVLQNLDMISGLAEVHDSDCGPMEIYLSEKDKEDARKFIAGAGLSGKKLAGIHAGSALLKNHVNKRWNSDGFTALMKHLANEKGYSVLLFGSETDLNKRLIADSGVEAVLASTPNFMDSIARMRNCDIFVSNDTAFLHCAAALGLKTVGIFGYTNSKELYPWMTEHRIVRHDLDCSPCFYNSPKPAECRFTGDDRFKCIRRITAQEVIEAVDELTA